MKDEAVKNDGKKHEPKERPDREIIPRKYACSGRGKGNDEVAYDRDEPRGVTLGKQELFLYPKSDDVKCQKCLHRKSAVKQKSINFTFLKKGCEQK